MKKILIITMVILTKLGLAQSPIFELGSYTADNFTNGMYIKDSQNLLNQYTGTWIWTDGNSSFEVDINKQTMVNWQDFYSDELNGKFNFTVNGTVLENNIQNSYSNYIEYPIMLSYYEPNRFSVEISGANGLNAEGTLVFNMSTSPYTAVLELRGKGASNNIYTTQQEYNNRPTEYNFPITDSIILTKQ